MENSQSETAGSFLLCDVEITALYQRFLECREVRIDSRQVQPGDLFVALQGQMDGNRFALDALAKGARYALVDDQAYQGHEGCLVVPNALTALQDLARYHRRRLGIPILALTGSNGKTTTKELITRVLAQTRQVVATKGNYNNHIGVPLTLLSIPEGTDMAIIEMGANAQGEIAGLCRIAEPDFGLITNIGKAHLEGFGGEEGVRKGKREIYTFLIDQDRLIFYNRDEAHLGDLLGAYQPAVSYGTDDPGADMSYHLDRKEPSIQLHYRSGPGKLVGVSSPLYGVHNYRNIMTAITVGRYFGVPDHRICQAIATYSPDNNRSQIIHRNGNTWIMDAYNANPTSMAMAIRSLQRMEVANKMAILGDMLEMGESSGSEHQKIVDLLLNTDIQPVLVGQAFLQVDCPEEWMRFEQAGEVAAWLREMLPAGRTILVKGSRGIALESAVQDWISENASEPA